MKKIVTIHRQAWINHNLVALLNALFPECTIDIVFSDRQGVEPYPPGSYPVVSLPIKHLK